MNTKTLNKKQWVVLIASACAFIFGVLFCVLSQSGIDIVKTILSIAVLGYGIFYLISYCILSMDGRDSLSLLHAIGGVAVGVLLIFVPSFFVSVISVIVVILGLARVYDNIKAKKEGNDTQKSKSVIGIFEAILGVALLVLCNTSVPQLLISIYLGVLLILESAINGVYLYFEIASQKYQLKPASEDVVADSKTANE